MCYAFCSELFRKHVGHSESIVLFIFVEVENGFNFEFEGSYFTVFANTVFNDVLMLSVNVTTIKADTPGCVESLFVVDKISCIAVNVRSLSNNSLCYENVVTNSTLFTGSETVCYAGGSYCGNCYLGVTGSGNGFFFGCATSTCNGALTSSGAGSGSNNGYVGAVGVSDHSDFFLCYENSVTNGALLTIGKTSLGAGCCLASNNFLGVSDHRNFFLCYEFFAALRALLTIGKTGLCAGCCLTGNNFLGMLVSGGGRFGSSNFCGLFSCCFYRSSSLGSFTEQLVEHITRSDSEHHSNGKNQSQNAQNVLVFHT